MAAVRTVKTVGTSVFLQPGLCRGHVLHTVGTVVTVHLVGHTEPTSDVKAVSAEVKSADWLQRSTTTLVPHQVQNRAVKRRGDRWCWNHWSHALLRSESSKY